MLDPRVALDERPQCVAAGPSSRTDVTGGCLDLLDVDVGVEHDREEVVARPARRQSAAAPVVGHADLVQLAPLHFERLHPLGDEDAGLDRAPRRDYRRPAAVLEATLASQLGADL